MIPEEEKQIIRRFMGSVDCPKDFSCLATDSQALCKARDIGSDIYLECLEDFPETCSLSMPFGETNFCRCPVRIYLARKYPSALSPPASDQMDAEQLGL